MQELDEADQTGYIELYIIMMYDDIIITVV